MDIDAGLPENNGLIHTTISMDGGDNGVVTHFQHLTRNRTIYIRYSTSLL